METDDEDGEESTPNDPLSAYAVNLLEKAAAGKIDPLIGRERELERTVHVLCRRRKNNPVFVGDPGVGKTAVVEGLALHVHQGKVPKPLERVRAIRTTLRRRVNELIDSHGWRPA